MYGFQKNAVFVLSKNNVTPKATKIGAKRPKGIRGTLFPCPTEAVTK